MRADRLQAVLQLRELAERRRLSERAAAEQALQLARLRRAAADGARDASPPPTARGVGPLQIHRLGGLALTDAADAAARAEDTATRELAAAEQRQVEAAVARRSVERLGERRGAEAAARLARATERQLDDVALETWRRRR